MSSNAIVKKKPGRPSNINPESLAVTAEVIALIDDCIELYDLSISHFANIAGIKSGLKQYRDGRAVFNDEQHTALCDEFGRIADEYEAEDFDAVEAANDDNVIELFPVVTVPDAEVVDEAEAVADDIVDETMERVKSALYAVSFASGNGKYHTDNVNSEHHKPLHTIGWLKILALVTNPQNVNKDYADWVIFSDLHTRNRQDQLENGRFFGCWLDLDKNPELSAILAVLSSLNCEFVVYSSKSSTPNYKKWRVLIPFNESATGEEHQRIVAVINDRFAAASIEPDRSTETCNQICYLPNKGEFYQYHVESNLAPLGWSNALADELAVKVEQEKQRKADAVESREASQHKAAQRVQSGQTSPVDAYKFEYDLHSALIFYGYRQFGNRYLSPNSGSGSPGVTIKDNKWFSSHESDAGIGRPCSSGGTFGDVFDLFVYYENDNNFDAALVAAGAMFTVDDGRTINDKNQDDWREQHSAANKEKVSHAVSAPQEPQYPSFKNNTEAKAAGYFWSADERGYIKDKSVIVADTTFSLTKFALNGGSKKMREKMLHDVFVLSQIALLGEITVIYAKPNTGKTLLTLWLLIQSIRAGRIQAEDVFYINADDSYKGLVEKLELGEEHGFNMLSPGHNDFKANDLTKYLAQLVANNDAKGKIIILDTAKKFVDLMDKKSSSKFMDSAREFGSHGGTLILLAHTNKNRDADKKVVFGGTSDLVDDCDCAFTLDQTDDAGGVKTVLFENIKNRGNCSHEVGFSYTTAAGQSYLEYLYSIVCLDPDQAAFAKAAMDAADKLLEDQAVIDAVIAALNTGDMLKTALVSAVHDAGHSKKRINQVLPAYVGSKWALVAGGKNSHLYSLI